MQTLNTVFIVDDDELVLETMRTVFFFAGFQTHTFHSAKEFINTYRPLARSCLILDLKMPELSGLELQSWLLEQKVTVPVIFLSGANDVGSAVQAMANGAFTFLQKPVDNLKVVSTALAAIEKTQSQEQAMEPLIQAKKAFELLSEREREIAVLISEGHSASTIAQKLCISNRTVESHKAHVFTKLNLHTVAQLTKVVILSTYPFLASATSFAQSPSELHP